MVKKSYKKKSYKKKSYKNKRKSKYLTREHTLVKMGVGFPRRLEFTHKYLDEFGVSANLGVMANYRFRCNGMFDPNFTATGHQPSYYDTLANLYDHWHVIGSKIELTFIPTSLPTAGIAVGLAINDDVSTTPTSYVNYNEGNQCKITYIAPNAGVPVKINMGWSAKKAFGGSILGNSLLKGDTASDPTEQQIFNVFVQAVDQLASVTINIVAKITYIAIWHERADVPLS